MARNMQSMDNEIIMEETDKIVVAKNKSEFENLPQHIIHHIMNFVPFKEAAKLGVLSKTLNSMCLSFPVLDFEWNDSISEQREEPNHTFLSSIFQILHHRCPHHMHNSLQRLRVMYIEGSRKDPFPFHVVTEELLNIAIKSNAKEIILHIVKEQYVHLTGYTLDRLFKSQFLTVLYLQGFRCPISNYIISCPKLKDLVIYFCEGLRTIQVLSLSLEKVKIGRCSELEGVVLNGKNLLNFWMDCNFQRCDINVSACETIKQMTLLLTNASKQLMDVVTDRLEIYECDLPENLTYHNPTIKVLEMRNNSYLKKMLLLATKLENFVYISPTKCSVDISACVALKILELGRVTLTDEYVRSTLSQLGCLMELTISDCDELEKMELKNEKLEKLSLKRCSKLKELIVDGPNMHTFYYEGSPQVYAMQILSTKFHTACIILAKRNRKQRSLLWYGNMKQFLRCFDQVKNLSIVCCQTEDLIFPARILKNDACPLRDTKHIKITTKYTIDCHTMTKLVDSILQLVDKLLELKLVMPGSRTGTLKFEYGKIVKRTKLRRCCLGTSSKCWRHYALKVNIQGFEASHAMNLDKLFDPYTSL